MILGLSQPARTGIIALTGLLAACGAQPRLEHADHPLAGRIWDVAAQGFVTEGALLERLAAADALVLGERHDNPRHHDIQARVIDGVAARGARPAVVFEMLDRSLQPSVEAVRRAHPGDVDALAGAVDWEDSGWPEWSMYRPVFAAAYRHGLPVRAGNLDAAEVRPLAREGWDALAEDRRRAFGLPPELPGGQDEAMEAMIRTSHCDLLPDSMIPGMLRVQQARNGALARSLADAARDTGAAVLITGNGHARADRGVPWVMGELAPELGTVALGLLEVDPEHRAAGDYADAEGPLPFDYVWFTAAVPQEDRCGPASPPRPTAPAGRRRAAMTVPSETGARPGISGRWSAWPCAPARRSRRRP